MVIRKIIHKLTDRIELYYGAHPALLADSPSKFYNRIEHSSKLRENIALALRFCLFSFLFHLTRYCCQSAF